jgi:hypothetical protein
MNDTIDLTPNFEQATNMCIVVLENGTYEGKKEAREELRRYARELDRLVAMAGAGFDLQDTPIEGK